MGEIADVERPVVEFAKDRGWLVYKMEMIGINGCPDRWFFRNRKLVIVEFKDEGKPLRPQQVRRIRELGEQGFFVHVIDNAEDGYALFSD